VAGVAVLLAPLVPHLFALAIYSGTINNVEGPKFLDNRTTLMTLPIVAPNG